MSRMFPYLLVILLSYSCADKYVAFKAQYRFTSKDGNPDYKDLQYWAAHPWKKDPSDSIPKPLRGQPGDSIADVFFLHPTTYTMKGELNKYNADIDNDYLNAKTDYSAILYQASVFNQHCRVFAPRYRQSNISTFFSDDNAIKEQSFELAYADIKIAFEYYLQHWNKRRPIIIASHSQGSKFAER